MHGLPPGRQNNLRALPGVSCCCCCCLAAPNSSPTPTPAIHTNLPLHPTPNPAAKKGPHPKFGRSPGGCFCVAHSFFLPPYFLGGCTSNLLMVKNLSDYSQNPHKLTMFNLLPVALNNVLQKTTTFICAKIAFASKQVMIFSKNSLLYIYIVAQ